MRQHDLLVKPNLRLKATRTPTRSKPRLTAPNQWWGIDMTKVMVEVGITQAFTSYNNPKGNADTERMMRTLKEELLWLREWTNPVELEQALTSWIEWYNQHYFHSALGYKTPNQWEREYQHSPGTQSAAA